MSNLFTSPVRDRWDITKALFFLGMLPGGVIAIFWTMSTNAWSSVPARLVVALAITAAGGLGTLLYLCPTAVAGYRAHRNTRAIGALNLLLGWTFFGWAVALIWALTESDQQQNA